MNTDPLRAYRQTRVKTATQGRLIVMLYDEGVKQIREAVAELGAAPARIERAHKAIVKAQDIITELMVSLDFEKGGEIAGNLFHLYMYFNQRLVDANLSKEPSGLKEILAMMIDLRDAWSTIENTAPQQESAAAGGINLAG